MSQQDETVANETPTFAMPRPSRTLTALTTGALALPGIAGSARADAPIERASASSSFSYYREDQIRQNRLQSGTGSNQRYEVYTKQLRFDLPTSERTDLGIDFLYEDMSGASPWFVSEEGGRFVQTMSGATIEDERFDLTLDLDYYMDNGKDTISGGFSIEKDYESWHGGIATERNFNEKNTTINLSIAGAFDEINPTGGGTNNRVVSDTKWSMDLFGGLTQILSRASTGQLTVNYKHSDGFLNDPYKLVAVQGAGNVSDNRRRSKDQVSVLARYRHHFEDIEGSLHLDYRFYVDSWSVTSHTAEIGWYQTLFDILTIAPSFRYYSQSQADFYEPVLGLGSNLTRRSSDFRLSPYGALSGRIKFEVAVNDLASYDPEGPLSAVGFTDGIDLILGLSYERYVSDGHLALQSVGEFEQAPGLVSFQVIAFTLSGQF